VAGDKGAAGRVSHRQDAEDRRETEAASAERKKGGAETMKLVMIEMMGGTRSFVGSLKEVEGEPSALEDCVEIKEVLAPGPQGPMQYHIGVKIGTYDTLGQVPRDKHHVFQLDNTSPLVSCYNTTMNQAIEKPTGGQILHYSGKTH
jgi:hypothetical protein